MALDASTIAGLVAGYNETEPKTSIQEILNAVATAIGEVEVPAVNRKGAKALGVLRVASAVQDGETVTIGADVYEVDTQTVADVTEGNIRLNLSGGTTVKAQGTVTIANVCVAGDTMTIGTKVYTFVPIGTANGDGEIAVGTDQLTQEAAIKAAINGTDGWNDPHPLVTCGDFAAHVGTITAISGGTAGNLIATTQEMTPAGNVFDGVTLGTATAGVDATAAEFTTALAAAINASGTEAVTAVRIGANEVLIFSDTIGASTTALAETLAGANNAWDTSALRAGAAAGNLAVARIARVPNAVEVALGNMQFPLDFLPSFVHVQVNVTTGGAIKAWDGGVTVSGTTNPYITITNAGDVDWAATDTVSVLAIQ